MTRDISTTQEELGFGAQEWLAVGEIHVSVVLPPQLKGVEVMEVHLLRKALPHGLAYFVSARVGATSLVTVEDV
jgi:hypothetical protein